MRAVDIIQRKRDGGALSPEEIEFFVAGVTDGSVPDYQAAALLMAILLRGMDAAETTILTDAMVRSGSKLDLSDIPGPKIDKHSTGGVGDKTSLVVAPVVAACGGIVPMMSGRGLGHTGGTVDKLESIPGFRTNLSIPEMRASLKSIGCVLISQTAEIAPADKALYALRDVTGTVPSIPLISASIMSKKIAEGIDALVLDVKSGSGTFMKTESDSRRLAESLVAIGRASGVRTEAVITAMDSPLGLAVGNAAEVIEALDVLKGRGPQDLIDVSQELSARMLVMGELAPDREAARQMVRSVIDSGAALEKFRGIIERQGGDPRIVDDAGLMPAAPRQHVVTAPASGYVGTLDAELIGRASVVLGGGRDRVDDVIDHAVAIMITAPLGAAVRAGDAVLELRYREQRRLDEALPLVTRALRIADQPPSLRPLIVGEVG
jgi:pyrimidine-nucleoside phosphorylase